MSDETPPPAKREYNPHEVRLILRGLGGMLRAPSTPRESVDTHIVVDERDREFAQRVAELVRARRPKLETLAGGRVTRLPARAPQLRTIQGGHPDVDGELRAILYERRSAFEERLRDPARLTNDEERLIREFAEQWFPFEPRMAFDLESDLQRHRACSP